MKRIRVLIAMTLVIASLATLTLTGSALTSTGAVDEDISVIAADDAQETAVTESKAESEDAAGGGSAETDEITAQDDAAKTNDTTIEIPPPKNSAPIAENLKYKTYRGVAVTGKFKAVDPDGDTLTYQITSMPKKGTVEAISADEFVYTPAEGKKGEDKFTYVAVDAQGGLSEEATVEIDIKKQKTKVTYSDMNGSDAHFAALALAENGIFVGQQLGSEYFFCPDETMTRGEFLAMCLAVAGVDTLSGISKTGFADDSDIPMWVKPYVSAGLMNGVIGGYKTENGQIVFNPNAEITFTEAAVLIDRALGLTDVSAVSAMFPDEESSVPAWAQSAAANLTACNILPDGLDAYVNTTVTRADAAKILMSSMEVLEARKEGGGGLLSWAQ